MKTTINALHSLLAPSAALLVMMALLFGAAVGEEMPETNAPEQEHADYGHYMDISGMVDRADTVVEGSVISSTPNVPINISLNPDRPMELRYTVLEVAVSDVLAGDLEANETIQIKYPVDANAPAVESCGIFFLEDYRDVVTDLPFSPINPTQGFMLVVDGKVEPPEGISIVSPDSAPNTAVYDAEYVKEMIRAAIQE